MAQNQQSEDKELEASYQQFKTDVKKVILTNLLIIVLLVALYFANQKFGWLNFLTELF